MKEENELVRIDQKTIVPLPKEVIAIAKQQADLLMDIVEKNQLFQIFNQKKYLVAEAWETILAFNMVDCIPRPIEPIKNKEDIIGYRSYVELHKAGSIIGGGEMTCYLDEFPCQGKQGHAKHRAAMSAAQTWAMAKAARIKFAWVAVLAGYQPTPAEEMMGEGQSPKGKKTTTQKPKDPILEARQKQVRDKAQSLGWDSEALGKFIEEHFKPKKASIHLTMDECTRCLELLKQYDLPSEPEEISQGEFEKGVI